MTIQRLRIPIAVVSALALASAPLGAQALPVDPTASLLSDIIRINTSNPPGRTQALADLLDVRFRAAGFTVEVFPTVHAMRDGRFVAAAAVAKAANG